MRVFRVFRVFLVSALAVGPVMADESRTAGTIGQVYPVDVFVPERLPHIGDLDRLITQFELREGESAGVLREDFGTDGVADWLVVSPDRLCGNGSCTYALFDGVSMHELGRFTGILIVLDRRRNGYPVIQTLVWREVEFSEKRTYVFGEKNYQVEEHVLIGEPERRHLESMLGIRR